MLLTFDSSCAKHSALLSRYIKLISDQECQQNTLPYEQLARYPCLSRSTTQCENMEHRKLIDKIGRLSINRLGSIRHFTTGRSKLVSTKHSSQNINVDVTQYYPVCEINEHDISQIEMVKRWLHCSWSSSILTFSVHRQWLSNTPLPVPFHPKASVQDRNFPNNDKRGENATTYRTCIRFTLFPPNTKIYSNG